MQLIVRKTKSFILNGHDTLTVNPGSEPLQVPDWVRETGTFKLAEQDGSITEVGPKPEPGIYIPTKAEVIAAGYTPEAADRIIAEQPKPEPGIYIPSKAELIAAGYMPDAADSIIAYQHELKDRLAGKPPASKVQDNPPVPPVPQTVATGATEKPAGATDDESEASGKGGWSAARRAAQEAKKAGVAA
jgi:hypothetical protein